MLRALPHRIWHTGPPRQRNRSPSPELSHTHRTEFSWPPAKAEDEDDDKGLDLRIKTKRNRILTRETCGDARAAGAHQVPTSILVAVELLRVCMALSARNIFFFFIIIYCPRPHPMPLILF